MSTRKRIKGPKSQFKNWNLFFTKDDGAENRQKILETFTDFWLDSSQKSVEIPGNCILGGSLFGVLHHFNGDDGFTDKIARIERIEQGPPNKNRFPHDLLCAETIDNQIYYFFSDNFDLYMLMLMGDAHRGVLKEMDNFYLRPKFRNGSYI